VFRTDASIDIGTGHVMRCLTLATALTEEGAECTFICRAHEGHLLEMIAARGFRTIALPEASSQAFKAEICPPHADWLGLHWSQDADDTLAAIGALNMHFDWLVVDHYALDAAWHNALRPVCDSVMVIDDLADRPHDCELLLDQSLGREPAEYKGLLPDKATTLLGPKYAILRPEFAKMRAESLARRAKPKLQNILVTMGGVDKSNVTTRVLGALAACSLPSDAHIVVVMGLKAPRLKEVRAAAANMHFSTDVRVGVDDMAGLMVASDLAIGAGGMTAIERCVVGLPTLMVVQATNQIRQAEKLEDFGAAQIFDPLTENFIASFAATVRSLESAGVLMRMSLAASDVAEGEGPDEIIRHIPSAARSSEL